jgi:hypothetical protein
MAIGSSISYAPPIGETLQRSQQCLTKVKRITIQDTTNRLQQRPNTRARKSHTAVPLVANIRKG